MKSVFIFSLSFLIICYSANCSDPSLSPISSVGEQDLDVDIVLPRSRGAERSSLKGSEPSQNGSLFILTGYMVTEDRHLFPEDPTIYFDLKSSKPVVLLLAMEGPTTAKWKIKVRSSSLKRVISVGYSNRAIELIKESGEVDIDSIETQTLSYSDGSWSPSIYWAYNHGDTRGKSIISSAESLTSLKMTYFHGFREHSETHLLFQYKALSESPSLSPSSNIALSSYSIDFDEINVFEDCGDIAYFYKSAVEPSNTSLFVLGIDRPFVDRPFQPRRVEIDFTIESALPIHLVVFSYQVTGWVVYVRSQSLVKVTVLGGWSDIPTIEIIPIGSASQDIETDIRRFSFRFSSVNLSNRTVTAIEELIGVKVQYYHACSSTASKAWYRKPNSDEHPSITPSPSPSPQDQLLDVNSVLPTNGYSQCQTKYIWSTAGPPSQNGTLFILGLYEANQNERIAKVEFSFSSSVPSVLVLTAYEQTTWTVNVRSPSLHHIIAIGYEKQEVQLLMDGHLQSSPPTVETFSYEQGTAQSPFFAYSFERLDTNSFINKIESMTGLKMNYFHGCYSANQFIFRNSPEFGPPTPSPSPSSSKVASVSPSPTSSPTSTSSATISTTPSSSTSGSPSIPFSTSPTMSPSNSASTSATASTTIPSSPSSSISSSVSPSSTSSPTTSISVTPSTSASPSSLPEQKDTCKAFFEKSDLQILCGKTIFMQSFNFKHGFLNVQVNQLHNELQIKASTTKGNDENRSLLLRGYSYVVSFSKLSKQDIPAAETIQAVGTHGVDSLVDVVNMNSINMDGSSTCCRKAFAHIILNLAMIRTRPSKPGVEIVRFKTIFRRRPIHLKCYNPCSTSIANCASC